MDRCYPHFNAGGDTDSNGALVGGLLGALNGDAALPTHLFSDIKGLRESRIQAELFFRKFSDTF